VDKVAGDAQLAVPMYPPPVTVAFVHVTVTAETGRNVQLVNVELAALTVSPHGLFFFDAFIVKLPVAVRITVPLGLAEEKVRVAGDTLKLSKSIAHNDTTPIASHTSAKHIFTGLSIRLAISSS
jgi:hypothetical protein